MAELNALSACPPSLVVTPHPVTLEGQQRIAAELLPRETLGHFLARTVPDYGSDAWEVRINGVRVPHQIIDKVRPKGGTVIEVRGTVGRTALLIVAMVALTIFTAGVGTAMLAAGYSAMAAGMAQAAIYAVGSLLINKVLGPKKPKQYESDAATVYTIGSARNQARPYEPLPLVLGNIRIAPDIASQPYSFYEANEQFMAMVLTPGINVARVEAMFNGDALLSTFEGVQVWHSGFPRMPEERIPLYSNVDTIAGGALDAEKGQPSDWVQRTSSVSTIRLQLDFDYMLFDTTSKGKPKNNQETIEVQYRTVGAPNWRVFGSFPLVSQSQKQQRRTYALDVAPGQYEVRARIAGRNTDGSGATSDFTWSALKSIQTDGASYAGIPRIGIRIKATGQLNGAPDELRCVAYAAPIPVWKGAEWVTEESSNPGAQILAYARGIRDPGGNLIAGLGLLDAQIDIAALQAFMLHCAASKYTYDNVIRDTRSHDDVLQAIALAGFGNVTWAAGRLSVVWAADEQPLSGVVNMATIKKGQFQIDYTLANAADGIEFTYVDRSDWSSKTLRVTAPGVQTMLNPAQVSGEGITTEEHAAKMARYHLAQSLYQYKDISFSTDIEHLSYRRMSVLALQHDLTQWGFGGRLVSAARDGSAVVLKLDDQVRAPATGNSFIGLRIPGELVYRVFRVASFAGETDQIRLADPWPADAPLPGNTDENPAHDTIWIFDFKQTPGYRVRVVGIEPESDLKGASVSVVPEGPEFWRYVESGQYIPAPNGSLLQTRPVASNLRVTEQQVVQGDTVFTELTATFDVSGPVGEVIVLSDLDQNSELEQVATTRTRTATWRIPQAGVYPITVRPYSPEGNAGVAVTVMYATLGADVPPVLVDIFDVTAVSGGVRRYTWGFLSDTVQSADFAGVEIRYVAGKVAAPVWDQMIPLGDDGYHVAAFEAVLPPAGDWTFACRSRNTSGALSEASRVVQKTLGANLGEVIGDLVEDLDEQTRKQVELQRQLDKEALERVLADANEAAARARDLALVNASLVLEAQTRAGQIGQAMDAIAAEGQTRATDLLNEKLEREAAITAVSETQQDGFDSLSRALSEVAAGSGTQFDSKRIWDFNLTTDSWTGNGAPTLVDGWLRPANAAANPYIQSPGGLAIDGSDYRFVKMRIKKVGNPTWAGALQWTTTTDAAWNAAKEVVVGEPAWDSAGVATLDVADIAWRPSTISAVRLQLGAAQGVSDYYLIDWLAIGRPMPAASVALVQEETQARVTALASEATQRNTLAVQMRGNYTGTDLSQAQGLMGDERTARAAADSSQVQRITTMEARMPAGTGGLATSASVATLQDAMVAADQANAQATTAVNSKLTGLRTVGDNLLPNSNFAENFLWWVLGGNSGGNTILRDAASGDGGPGVTITRATAATAPFMDANDGAFFPVRAGMIFRARVRVKLLSGNGNVLLRVVYRNAENDQFQADRTITATAEWTDFTVDYGALPAGSVRALFRVYVHPSIGTVSFDRVELYDVTDQAANQLTAAGLQSITTRTGVIEGTLVAQGSALTQVQADVAGKASNAALTSLDSKVTQLGSTVTSQGTALTNVTASLQNIGGDNLLGNSSFEMEAPSAIAVPGWGNNSGGLGAAVTRRLWSDSTLPGSTRSWRWELDNAPTTGYLETISNSSVKSTRVIPGEKVTLSAYLRGTVGTRWFLQLAWYDANGAIISYIGSQGVTTLDDENWSRKVFTPATTPVNAIAARAYMRVYGLNIVGQWVEWDNVQLQVGSVATGYSPSLEEIASATAANAAAASTLTGKVTVLEGTTTAQGQAITTVNAAIAATQAAGPNIVIDAGFEGYSNGQVIATGIVGGSLLASGADMQTGVRSARLLRTAAANASNTDAYIGPIIRTTAGRVFYIEVYAKLDAAGASPGSTQFRFGMRTVSAAGVNSWVWTGATVNIATFTGWTKISGYVTAPANTNTAQLLFSIPGANAVANAAIFLDNVIWQDVTDAYGAKTTADAAATGLSALTTTVTQQGGQITSQATQLNQVQATVAGKADSSVVASMSAAVASIGRGGNLITNSTFPQWQRNGWGWYSNPWGFRELGDPTGDAVWTPTGVTGIGSMKPGTLANGADGYFGTEYFIGIEGGKTYCVSGYMSNHRCSMMLYAEFYDAVGTIVGNIACPSTNARTEPPVTLSKLARPFVIGKAPANAASARIIARVVGTGEIDPYFWLWRPMFSEVGDGATSPPPWSAGGSESSASWQVMMNTDGYVSGLQLMAKGQKSQFNVLASAMNILSPGGADGIEMTNGYLRVWRGSSQRIIGNGFGNSGEGLMDYFGPNVGAAAASKANATVWMDVNGNAYWGGSLAAGVLRNAVQSTQTNTVGTEVVNGPFGTNGRNKSVVVSFNRRVNRQKNQYGMPGFVAGGGSNTCTVNVYRKIDNDPETFWTSFTAGGGIDIYNETDGPDIATSYWAGSVTLNDGGDGSRPRQYRAQIVSYSEQGVSHQSGSYDFQSTNQSLSIVSTEV
ncbi:phage tail protein [Stenotrophomonas maltophilia]|uniref:Phage tail protein n=1 Tax=Stenotrophomonas maltophilia TaxID=40324 RepID=A0A246HN14_STEMA|nr:host specificity factor TipJ family phage tail protein [Stenotrophomonas maltophilia]OWQ54016.1 phage tail protein [Stenotrophomonas maltophilia]